MTSPTSVALRIVTFFAANTNDELDSKVISARALASATLDTSCETSPSAYALNETSLPDEALQTPLPSLVVRMPVGATLNRRLVVETGFQAPSGPRVPMSPISIGCSNGTTGRMPYRSWTLVTNFLTSAMIPSSPCAWRRSDKE
jgi:hypothetical protein